MGFDIKPMSVSEMSLALDRISRFKFPEDKLKRVYVETVCSHYIKSKGKKQEIEKLDYKLLTEMFTEIWNFSVEYNFGNKSDDYSLNKNYIEEEKKCYNLSAQIQKLMPAEVDFKTLLKNIKNIPNKFDNYKTPVKIVLTEGITEEFLLPEFSKIIGYNWDENYVKILGTGGKSRIVNLYNTYKTQIKIPIYILLDSDAKIIYEQIKPILKKTDFIHLIHAGEIEDIIPVNLFKRAINSEFKNQSKISVKDFDKNISMVENLHNIYKNNGFGEFKKAKMAQMIKQTFLKTDILTDELLQILNEIKTF